MKILNKINDERINASNILMEMTIGEYHGLSDDILHKNDFQRSRVKSSGSVYSLLKKDIAAGCVIPPIVLALSCKEKLQDTISDTEVINMVKEKKDSLIILDGLQRTFTIKDLLQDAEKAGDTELTEKVASHPLRVEIYLGLNKLGILYRMLTLNTGQTKMSMRHQIEILYSDYLTNTELEGISFFTEADQKGPNIIGEYKFRDAVEGFNSFLTEDYLTIDRQALLDSIENLEHLSKKNSEGDLFESYMNTYNHLAQTIKNHIGTWEFKDETFEGQPFFKNADKLFIKSQVLTGFGAAVAKLIDHGQIDSLEQLEVITSSLDNKYTEQGMENLVYKLEEVKQKATKIGNDQRLFFFWLFRRLFDKDADSYLNFDASVNEAYKSYIRETQ